MAQRFVPLSSAAGPWRCRAPSPTSRPDGDSAAWNTKDIHWHTRAVNIHASCLKYEGYSLEYKSPKHLSGPCIQGDRGVSKAITATQQSWLMNAAGLLNTKQKVNKRPGGRHFGPMTQQSRSRWANSHCVPTRCAYSPGKKIVRA